MANKPRSPASQPLKLLTVRQLMTPEQCAEFLGVKVATIYTWVSHKQIPFRKLGAHRNAALRFDLDEIVEWTKQGNDNRKS